LGSVSSIRQREETRYSMNIYSGFTLTGCLHNGVAGHGNHQRDNADILARNIFGYKAIVFSALGYRFCRLLLSGDTNMFTSGMSDTARIVFSFITFLSRRAERGEGLQLGCHSVQRVD